MSYDTDFYGWATEQAALLRAGKLADADLNHIAEEIESMGRSEKREMASRLAVLLLHLLKWRYQPERRSASWQATIRIQRRDLATHLKDNPSLEPQFPDVVAYAYENAVIEAAAETGLSEETFPATCLWSKEAIMDAGFWP